jgi:hypothetical protein
MQFQEHVKRSIRGKLLRISLLYTHAHIWLFVPTYFNASIILYKLFSKVTGDRIPDQP